VSSPADGYVLWLSDTYMKEFVWNFQPPVVGEAMELEYFLMQDDAEGFTLDGVEQIIGGAPRLVKDGAAWTEQEEQFAGDRFKENYASSRTAVGVTAEGKLVFISTGSATIPQLRELMLSLGCVDAFNLDGGASTGLYYNGTIYRTPGRLLATTVQIYVD
jgi:exopolysaccharide biosynthesis protein